MSLSKEAQFWNTAHSGDLSLVRIFAADAALNINWQESSQGYTAFSYACYEGHVSVVQFLLTLPKVDVNKQKKKEATPFNIACQKGRKEVVSLLLADMRIDVNKAMDGGFTPFFMACQNDQKEVVSLLMADMRIDVNKPENDQCTPFGWSHKKATCQWFRSSWPLEGKLIPRPSPLPVMRVGTTKLLLKSLGVKAREQRGKGHLMKITSERSKMAL